MSESTETTESTTTEPTQAAERSSARSLDDLPAEYSWVKDEVKRARDDAAKYRTRAREFAEADFTYEDAKSALSDIASLREQNEAELEKAHGLEIDVLRERAARKHKLDDETYDLLVDSSARTEEEISAKAEKLATLIKRTPDRPVDPAQGSTASGGGKKVTTADQFADFVGERLKS